jgi:hypothetical protein
MKTLHIFASSYKKNNFKPKQKMRKHTTTTPSQTVGFEEITPEYAANIVEKYNTNNRNLVKRRAEFFRDRINDGTFRECSTDCIAFSPTNELLNGQHRLLAIALSGKTIRMTVMRNVPQDKIYSMDSGAKRKASDTLAITGVMDKANSANLTAIINFVNDITYKRYGTAGKGGGDIRYALTVDQIADIYTREKVYYDAALQMVEELYAITGQKRKILPTNQLGAWFYMLSFHNVHTGKRLDLKDKAFEFMVKLFSGSNLDSTDPILMLRDRLLNTDKFTTRNEPIGLLTKVLNAYYHNEPIKRLRYSSSEGISSLSWGETKDVVAKYTKPLSKQKKQGKDIGQLF